MTAEFVDVIVQAEKPNCPTYAASWRGSAKDAGKLESHNAEGTASGLGYKPSFVIVTLVPSAFHVRINVLVQFKLYPAAVTEFKEAYKNPETFISLNLI